VAGITTAVCLRHDRLVTVAIRTAVVADLDSVRGVFRRASLSNDGDREHLLAHPEVLVLSDDGIREERTRLAVEPGGRVVGFASWIVRGDTIEMEDLFVEPQWMRRGIGLALVLDMVDIADRRMFSRLEVTANPHGREFYERAGFIADHVVETDFYPAQRMHRNVP
jgi:GNAT superfamily N-acetyltransferase